MGETVFKRSNKIIEIKGNTAVGAEIIHINTKEVT